jgi:hypothetical protein
VISDQWLVVSKVFLTTGHRPLTHRGKGAVAQLGERLVCNQEATGSIPVSSTRIVEQRPFRAALTDREKRALAPEGVGGSE